MPLLWAFAHRAWNPPTSSSLADEKRVCSLLLSTAVRDSRRSRPVINCRRLIICGLDHSLSGSQRAVTVLVAPFCTEVSDPERSPRRASSRAELVPGVFHTPSAIGGASSVTEMATRPSSGAIATSIAPAPAFKALPTRSFSTNRARSRSSAEQRVDTDIDVGLGPDGPRQCEYRSLEILHAPSSCHGRAGRASASRAAGCWPRRQARRGRGEISRISRARCSMSRRLVESAPCVSLITNSRPGVRLLLGPGRAASS